MGFINTSNQKKWITVAAGNLVVKAREGEEGAVRREYTNPKTGEAGVAWEFQHQAFEGKIVGAQFEETEYGQYWTVDLYDDSSKETYQLRLKVDSRLFEQFAKRVPNIDISKKVTIGAGLEKSEKGDRNYLWIRQDGEPVKYAFTKENPNGIPAPIEKKVMGKTKWDYTEQVNFLYNLCNNWFTNQVEGLADEYSPEVENENEVPF